MSEPGLPNLVIIGAMKSATTSLNHYLGFHPEIYTVRAKELDFFVEEHNWGKGLDWYKSWFATDRGIRGEASPNYTMFPFARGVPERMHAVIPEAKLIYILRDPVERMISHYDHARFLGREQRPIDAALTDLDSRYFYRSRYHLQLEQYLPYYDLSRILIASSEELLGDRIGTLKRIFRFLGVDEAFRSPAFETLRHVSSSKRRLTPVGAAIQKVYGRVRPLLSFGGRESRLVAAAKRALSSGAADRPPLGAAARETITAHLAEDIARLRALTGRDFSEWST